MMIPKETILGCGDASCEMLVSPIPHPKGRPLEVALPRRRRVVILDHGKPNSLAILARTNDLLRERGIEVLNEILRKPSATTWMGDAIASKLEKEEGLVLCGISDCGSCAAGTSLDAIGLHRRGVAGIPVFTAPFREVLDRALAYYLTDASVPAIILDHPMQNISAEELDQRARAVADAAEGMLPSPA